MSGSAGIQNLNVVDRFNPLSDGEKVLADAFADRICDSLGVPRSRLLLHFIDCDSMAPAFRYKDFVLIDTGETRPAERSGVYAFAFDGALTLRKVVSDITRVEISAENPLYHASRESLSREEARSLDAVGRVVFHGRYIVEF